MNYQFKRDLHGTPFAHFDMGGETFSRWFSDELGSDKKKIETILLAIQQLQTEQIKEFVLAGREINLVMGADEVEVRSKVLDVDSPDELPEGTELYDQEFISGCGLEDFIQVLSSWAEFVA